MFCFAAATLLSGYLFNIIFEFFGANVHPIYTLWMGFLAVVVYVLRKELYVSDTDS